MTLAIKLAIGAAVAFVVYMFIKNNKEQCVGCGAGSGSAAPTVSEINKGGTLEKVNRLATGLGFKKGMF